MESEWITCAEVHALYTLKVLIYIVIDMHTSTISPKHMAAPLLPIPHTANDVHVEKQV